MGRTWIYCSFKAFKDKQVQEEVREDIPLKQGLRRAEHHTNVLAISKSERVFH